MESPHQWIRSRAQSKSVPVFRVEFNFGEFDPQIRTLDQSQILLTVLTFKGTESPKWRKLS